MSSKNKGFSIPEMLIAFAVTGILVAVVAMSFIPFRNAQALQNTTDAIVSMLQDARANTLAGKGGNQFGVHIDSSAVVSFIGDTYDADAVTNQTVSFESPVSLDDIDLNGGGSQVVFQKLTGTTTNYGTIVVALPSGITKTITISTTGSVTRD